MAAYLFRHPKERSRTQELPLGGRQACGYPEPLELVDDEPHEMRRIARFLDIPLTDEGVATILPVLSLEAMRRNGERTMPAPAWIWKEGAQTFFFKGANGRWRDVLTAEEVALYEETATRVLTPECRAWLEHGRAALGLVTQDKGAL